MNWINLRTETLRSPAFANAKPGAIETWLKVMAYCCEQENGGCIVDGCSWADRAWLMCCGVTKVEVEAASPLIYDDGVAVFVDAYPDEKEAEVQAKRRAGKRGGKASGKARREAQLEAVLEAPKEPEVEASLERKGMEGKEKGKEGERKRREKKASGDALEILDYLNEKADRSYRPIDANLNLIQRRLEEPEVTVQGCKLMIDRQVALWKGDRMEEYLRPATLFGKEKFSGYYDNRTTPLPTNGNAAQHSTEPDLPDRTFELGPDETESRFAAARAEAEAYQPRP